MTHFQKESIPTGKSIYHNIRKIRQRIREIGYQENEVNFTNEFRDRYADRKKEANHYCFHLSDLHLGTKNIEVSERRLKSLIKAQLSTLEPDDKIDFIITGDAVDVIEQGSQREINIYCAIPAA